MEPRTPLGKVYIKCVSKIANKKASKKTVFFKLPGEDNHLRAKHFPDEGHVQIGRYQYTRLAFSEGIYGWGYPSFGIEEELPYLYNILSDQWLQTSPSTQIRLFPSGLWEKPTLVLSEIEFVCKQHPDIKIYMRLGALEIPDKYRFWRTEEIAKFLDILWEKWLREFHENKKGKVCRKTKTSPNS